MREQPGSGFDSEAARIRLEGVRNAVEPQDATTPERNSRIAMTTSGAPTEKGFPSWVCRSGSTISAKPRTRSTGPKSAVSTDSG